MGMAAARFGFWHWVAAALALAAAIGLWRAKPLQWPQCRRLVVEGQIAQGWVTAKGGDSESVYYSFWVGEGRHSGVGSAGYGNPEFGELAVGDNVLVSYLAKAPDVSILGLARERLRDQNRVIALALLFAAPVLLLALRREFKRE